jgi:hypothetical protein
MVLTPLGEYEARQLTDEVKADAAALWDKLLALYEGKAHEALGYSSWGTYFEAEFGQDASRGYQLLDAGRVRGLLAESTNVERLTEGSARELVPLKDDPEAVRDVWQEATERSNGRPTAAVVRDVVRERVRGMAADSEAELQEATAHWTPEQRAAAAPERMRTRGELMRLAEDLAAMPDPRTFAHEHRDLPPRAVQQAEAAHAWLTDFLSEWRHDHGV